MSHVRKLVAFALAVVLAGCSEGEILQPETAVPDPSLAHAAAASVDLGGEWNWSNVELLRLPEHVVVMLGLVPEGPNTRARCESAGTMTLVQSGTAFEGTAFKISNACLTKGGQSFQQPGTVFQVADGRIRGKSVAFSFHSFTVRPCPHQAVVSADATGEATALSGTGRCVLPGHPQSESPVDLPPPPGGTSKTLSWEATRP